MIVNNHLFRKSSSEKSLRTGVQGVALSEVESLQDKRAAFEAKALSLIQTVFSHLPFDGTADFYAAGILKARLPPVALSTKIHGHEHTVSGSGKRKLKLAARHDRASDQKAFIRSTMGQCRLLAGDAGIEVVHCFDNFREVHAEAGNSGVSCSLAAGLANCDRALSKEGVKKVCEASNALGPECRGPHEERQERELMFPHSCGPALEALLGFSNPSDVAPVVLLSDVPATHDNYWTRTRVAAALQKAGLLTPV